MKCKSCGSDNLVIMPKKMHKELICGDCLTYQKFLNKKDAERLQFILDNKKEKTNAILG